MIYFRSVPADYSLPADGAESSTAAGQSGHTAECRVRSFSDSDLHSKKPQSAVYTQEMKPSTSILAAGSAAVHDHGVGRRARAASDMSELICASQRTAFSTNAASNSGCVQIVNTKTTTVTDSPAAAAASADAWMWKWGTLPKKKRTKSCASDLQGLAHQSTTGIQHPIVSVPPPISSSSGAVHGDRTLSNSRGRSVSLPLLALLEESKSAHSRHRRRHSPKGKQHPLFQTVTAVETDIPSAHSMQRLNADDAGAAEDFASMHAAAARDTSAFHSLSLCGDCLSDSAVSPPNTQELWRLLEERRITPRDIVSIGGPPERALMRSPDLVVILQDYLLPVPIAEHLLVLLKDRRDQEDRGDEWLGEQLQKFLTASDHTWPEWAGRRISQWGSGAETRVDAHPDNKELTWARIPWQESFSDLVQAYRVQDIHNMYAAGAVIADKELFAASPLLQDMVSVGHGKHALSYRELWHRQQQQQQTIGANMSFTALLTLDAGHSSSLYCDYHDLGKWHSEDAHDGYGVGYALHTDRASEGSESQHSLPMLVGLDDDHLHSGLLPASVLNSADALTVPVTPAPTVATSPFPHSAATYMHDAPYRSLSNRAPASSFDGDSSQAEGDTDTDNISLQDIDLDDISPEPAGGDFYESDTDSYLSLSLEEEDMGGAAGAGAFISGAKAGTPAPLGSPQGAGPTGIPLMRRRFKRYRYRKVLVPSQEQLEMLNLQEGPNDIAFELEGCAPLKSCLFVWPSDARIVVTDLAGIFSKSNRNSGVWISFLGGGSYYSSTASKTEFDSCIRLFAGLHQQGYRIIYMAQGAQSSATSPSAALLSSQEYLSSIKASTGESLPPGPVFKSPDSLVRAFGAARTEVFKASALRGVKSLFPSSHNPYHACFCTRESDAIPFARFGFSEGRIFLVSENGDIKSANRTCVLSFPRLSELLHQIFPLVIGTLLHCLRAID